MRKPLFLFISIFSLIILFGCATVEVESEQQEKAREERYYEEARRLARGQINSSQPLPIGEVIFSANYSIFEGGRLIVSNTVSYTYLGIDDKNNVRVMYDGKIGPPGPPEEKKLPLLLPLNNKKQTILRVKTAYRGTRDLLITVVDEFNRITVEEIVETQTK